MRTMTVTAMANGSEYTLFPNGFSIDANNVMLGSCIITGIQFQYASNPTNEPVVKVYDGVLASPPASSPQGYIQRGGAGGELFSVIATGHTNTSDDQPYDAGAPDATVSNCRLVGAASGDGLSILCAAGCAIHIDQDAGVAADVTITYEPLTNGRTRILALGRAIEGVSPVL